MSFALNRAENMQSAVKYDVAISFAGEQRREARSIADCLTKAGVGVFFDEYVEADLWGKNLYDHLSDVYQNQARYCMILVSEAYATKIWTTHERESAQARALQENREYILPVRFDQTVLPGLLPTIGYLDFHRHGIDGICQAFLRKMKGGATSGKIENINKITSSPLALILRTEIKTIGYVPVVNSRWGTKEISLLLEPDDPTDGPFLDGLRTSDSKVYVAYNTNVALCSVIESVHINEAGRNRWDLRLRVEDSEFRPSLEMGTSTTSVDEFAIIRARRLLLNEEPAKDTRDLNRVMHEIFVGGHGTELAIKKSPFPHLFQQNESDPQRFLEIAWIFAIFQLKLSATVSEILRLELALNGASLEIQFLGKRRKEYDNVPPAEIKIEGVCPLR